MGELRACLDESAAGLQSALALFPPCNELTQQKLADLSGQMTPATPACDMFSAKCPEIGAPGGG